MRASAALCCVAVKANRQLFVVCAFVFDGGHEKDLNSSNNNKQ
jgi:hypothetical protein